MNNNPIKQLMKARKLKQREYARLMSLDETWVSSKIKKGIFNLAELIELANLTNTQLSFVDIESKEVIVVFEDKLCDKQ